MSTTANRQTTLKQNWVDAACEEVARKMNLDKDEKARFFDFVTEALKQEPTSVTPGPELVSGPYRQRYLNLALFDCATL